MFYLFESPESAKAQEVKHNLLYNIRLFESTLKLIINNFLPTFFKSISRIIQYMDTNLVFYKDFAFKSNYNRLVRLLWEKLLAEIEINLKKDDQVINER